jgi:hypothetical protein
MTGVRMTAMSVVVDDVVSLSRGAVKGATHGVFPDDGDSRRFDSLSR